MVDVTAPTSTTTRFSSRQYLEELRARRAAKSTTPATATQPAPQPSINPELVQPLLPVEPVPMAPSDSSTQNYPLDERFSNPARPIAEETIFEWKAASRPFKKRNRQFYTTVGLITMLVSLILFFAGQFLPIAVVISVAFLGYVLSSVAPETVENKITTYGIRTDTLLFYWDELGRFWYDKKYNQPIVNIEVARFPGRITLLFSEEQQNELTVLLSAMLLQQKPQETFIDKSAKWLQEKVPLDVN